MTDPAPDPIREQRAKWARFAALGQRTGYTLFLAAILAFFLGLITGWSSTYSSIIVGCLVGGSVLLAPAIVVGYAVKAAEREDREAGR